MRKGFFRFLVLPFLVISCNSGKPPVAEDKMAAVLADIHLAEVRATQIPADSGSQVGLGRNLDSLAGFYQTVLQHHNLDTTAFREALDWYMAHPETLDSVYKKSIVQLEKTAAEAP